DSGDGTDDCCQRDAYGTGELGSYANNASADPVGRGCAQRLAKHGMLKELIEQRDGECTCADDPERLRGDIEPAEHQTAGSERRWAKAFGAKSEQAEADQGKMNRHCGYKQHKNGSASEGLKETAIEQRADRNHNEDREEDLERQRKVSERQD